MPNRLYNKQVTPKGYKAGGMARRMGKKKPVLSEEGKRKIKSRMTGGDSTGILFPDVYKVKKMGGGRIKKKMGGGMMMERPMMQKGGPSKKPKVRKIGVIGVGKAKDYPGIKEIIKMNKQGKKRFGMKMGGALKPVDPKTQKGLSKLPTEVRNKMGYMQDGGKVKKAGLFKLDKNTLLQFKDLMTGSSDSPSGKLKKFVKDMENKNKKEKKSNGK